MDKSKKGDKQVNRGYTINTDEASSLEFSKMILGKLKDIGLSPPVFRTLSMIEILNLFKDDRLDVFPDYQRGVVSNLEWAKELVSVMVYSAAPLNPIYMQCVGGDMNRFEVVDGAQRLSAFLLFMMGSFSIKADNGVDDVWFENQCKPDCGWWSICEGKTNGGVKDYLEDKPLSSALIKFYEQTVVGDMVERQPSTFEFLAQNARDNFMGRHLSVTVMPCVWNSELSILYMVYTNLKMWKQTKDECLVHLHDRASRQLKSIEKEIIGVIEMCKIKFEFPTRQAYGVLVRLFACLSKFDSVPSDMDEYNNLMLEMVNRYSESDPDPDVIQRVRSSFRRLAEQEQTVSKFLSRKKLSSDLLVAILYVASSPGTTVHGLKKLTSFIFSAKKDYESVLNTWRFRPAGGMAKEFGKFWTQASDRNLIRLCGMCLRLSSHFPDEEEEDSHASKQRRVDGVN